MQFRTLEFKDYNIFESIKVNTVRDGYLHACLEVLYEMQVEPNSMHWMTTKSEWIVPFVRKIAHIFNVQLPKGKEYSLILFVEQELINLFPKVDSFVINSNMPLTHRNFIKYR